MNRLLRKDSKPFFKVLDKLTDSRYNFNINHDFKNGENAYKLDMFFDHEFIASCSIPDFDVTTAFDCLVDLVQSTEKQSHSTYFDVIGVSFKLYHCKNLNGKNFYSFRKYDSDKWIKISNKLAEYILEQKNISIEGSYDNVLNTLQYDCYYDVNLKGE